MKKFLTLLTISSLISPLACQVVSCGSNQIPQEFQNFEDPKIEKNFLAYYRAWRDKAMHGVNTTLPDKNWMTMDDIPYGINIVNIFSYVPPGEESKAQPYFDKLKSDYGPTLHKRGVKLIRGFDYGDLYNWWAPSLTEDEPSDKEVIDYANNLFTKLTNIGGFQLDGLDVDMEQFPTPHEIKLANRVVDVLSTKIGPKSNNPNTLFLYDTNGSYLEAFEGIKDSFDLLAYQQYGDGVNRTKKAYEDYKEVLDSNKFMPGLTFPEEGDANNRWHDATLPYEESNFANVARYVNEQNLGGMFVYALDRDGRNYEDDLTRIVPSNLLWTKTALLEANGVSLETAKTLALHHLIALKEKRQSMTDESFEAYKALINRATNLLEANAAIMGYDKPTGLDPTYDPILEISLMP